MGVISKKDALELSMVGPFGRASGLDYDVRMFGDGAYADLANKTDAPISCQEAVCGSVLSNSHRSS